MADTFVQLVGNLTDDPDVRFTPPAPRSAASAWP
jgi:single-stranded DNA-binding protein